MRRKNALNFIISAVGMTALGGVFGMAGGFIGAHVVSPVDLAALGAAIFGLIIGYIIGAIGGLFLLKYTVHVNGSVLLGTLAAAVWTFLSVGVSGLMNQFHDASSVIVVIAFLLIPTAALSGFYLKRASAS